MPTMTIPNNLGWIYSNISNFITKRNEFFQRRQGLAYRSLKLITLKFSFLCVHYFLTISLLAVNFWQTLGFSFGYWLFCFLPHFISHPIFSDYHCFFPLLFLLFYVVNHFRQFSVFRNAHPMDSLWWSMLSIRNIMGFYKQFNESIIHIHAIFALIHIQINVLDFISIHQHRTVKLTSRYLAINVPLHYLMAYHKMI
jgi:hypothetical protein